MPALSRVAGSSRWVLRMHFRTQTWQVHTLEALGGIFVSVEGKDCRGVIAVSTVGRLVQVSPW